MFRRNGVLFIFAVALVHFGCCIALFADRMSRAACNIPPYTGCITPESRILEAVTSFPIFASMRALDIYQRPHPISFALVLINSLAAGVVLWLLTLAISRLFHRRVPKQAL
jgi:hypothetical protein